MPKTRLLIVALALAAAVAGLALFNRPPPAPGAGPAPPPEPDEPAALAASGGIARRDGAALQLRLKGGELLTLTDRTRCGDLPCPAGLARRYRYLGWNAAGGGYRLVDTAGGGAEMLLPWSDEPPVLTDPRHAAAAEMPLPPPPAAGEADPDLADWLHEIADGRLQSEAPKIAAARDRVRRDGPLLTLSLADGRTLQLADDLVCGQAACPPQIARSFDFAGGSPDGRYLVIDEHWDEANAALLIDGQTGAATELLGLPKFSPDGRRAAAAVSDLEWAAPRRLEIWSLAGPSPLLEYSVAARDEDDTIYEVASWTDGEHLLLRRGPWTGPARSEVMLVHDAEGWHLETADAAN